MADTIFFALCFLGTAALGAAYLLEPLRGPTDRQTGVDADGRPFRHRSWGGVDGRSLSEEGEFDLRLHPPEQGLFIAAREPLDGAAWTTGDEAFDAAVRLAGDGDRLLAITDVEGRALLRACVSEGFAVTDDRIVTRRRFEPLRVPELLAKSRELAQLLGAQDVPARLVRIASSDPVERMRTRAFRVLVSEFPSEPGLGDLAPRFLIGTDAATRLAAVRWLVSHGDAEARGNAIRDALDGKWHTDAAIALDHLTVDEARQSLAAIRRWAGTPHEDAREAAHRAATRVAGHLAESTLLEFLDTELGTIAAEALGAHGSVAAIERLLAIADGVGARRLRDAAREAARQIQSRLGNVDPGRLSVHDHSGDEVGALSVAPEGGELSVERQPSVRIKT